MIAWLLHMGRIGRIGHSGLGEDAGLDSRFCGNDGDVLGPTVKKSPRRLPEALIALLGDDDCFTARRCFSPTKLETSIPLGIENSFVDT